MTVLTLPYPPTANNLYRNLPKGGRVKTGHYNAWLHEAGWSIKAQHPSRIIGRYMLTIIADAPDRRARDVDNLIKPVSDLLKKAGVIEEDSLAKSVMAAWSDVPATKGAGIRVMVEAVDPVPASVAERTMVAIDRIREVS